MLTRMQLAARQWFTTPIPCRPNAAQMPPVLTFKSCSAHSLTPADSNGRRVFSLVPACTCGERSDPHPLATVSTKDDRVCLRLHQIVRSWCERWCKRSRRLAVCARRLDGFPFGLPPSQRQRRQRVEGAAHVEQGGVGVDVHGQVDLAVPHGGLGGSRGNTALAHQAAERVPQGVYVEGPASLVSLRNGSQFEVAVEDLAQLVRYLEGRRTRGPACG